MVCEVVEVQPERFQRGMAVRHQEQQQHSKSQQSQSYELNYRTAWRLGSGSYGAVYLCKHLRSEQLYAVKISNFNHSMFKKEAEMMAYVTGNPNIVQFKERFDQPNDIRIVMEYCPMDLIDLWNNKFKWERSGPLNPKWEGFAQIIFKQMVLGVHHCHKSGVVHCDIKPDNFLLGWDGLIKLTDFAFAQHVPKDERLNVRIGTLYYMAPEVLQQDYSFKADIYSLGVSLLYMLIGKRLSNQRVGDNDSYSRSLSSTEINWNEAPLCYLPAQCVQLLQAMLSKDEHMRPTTAALLNSPWLSEIESDMSIPVPNLPYLTPPPHSTNEIFQNTSSQTSGRHDPSQNSANSSQPHQPRTSKPSKHRMGGRTSGTPSPVSPIDPPTPVISSEFVEAPKYHIMACLPNAKAACDEWNHYCGLIQTIRTFLGAVTEVNRTRTVDNQKQQQQQQQQQQSSSTQQQQKYSPQPAQFVS